MSLYTVENPTVTRLPCKRQQSDQDTTWGEDIAQGVGTRAFLEAQVTSESFIPWSLFNTSKVYVQTKGHHEAKAHKPLPGLKTRYTMSSDQ